MQRAPTRSQLRVAQRKKIPHHFLGDDFAKDQSVLEHSDLYRKRAQENITRYGSSRTPLHQPSSFLDLPVEVLSGICNSLNITERDVDALATLAQTCQIMKNIVTDKTRMRTSFQVYPPLQSWLLRELYDWSSLHHARKLVQYTETYQEYITEQIVPHMKAMDGLTDAQPTDVPHTGFRTLL